MKCVHLFKFISDKIVKHQHVINKQEKQIERTREEKKLRGNIKIKTLTDDFKSSLHQYIMLSN